MLDLASIIGTILAFAGVIGGQLFEGGSLGQILQGAAALIVLGGTAGAVLLSFPMQDVRSAFRMVPKVYSSEDLDVRPAIEEIVRVAAVARKEGVLAVESQRAGLRDPLFKKSIKYVIDGFEVGTVREIIDTEIQQSYDEWENAGKVFEAAGGYAPTFGILGAVLGLVHVMTQLDEPSKIGQGIAVALVATVYGIGLANLVLLPWGAKLKRKAAQRALAQEVIKLGVIGIQEGLNPHFLQEKLLAYVSESQRQRVEKKA